MTPLAILRWMGVAVFAMAPTFQLGAASFSLAPITWWLVGAGALAITLGVVPLGAEQRALHRRVPCALATSLAVGCAAAVAYSVLWGTVLRAPNLAWLGAPIRALASGTWPMVETTEGAIALRNHDGTLVFALTPAKLGVLQFGAFISAAFVMVWVEGRRWTGIATAVAVAAGTLVARSSLDVMRFAQIDSVLAQGTPSRLLLFANPLELGLWLLATAVCVGAFRGRVTGAVMKGPTMAPWQILIGAVAVAVGAGGLSFTRHWLPAGETKPGRVLVDDRTTDVWEPAARRITTEWYGDFSTYSFSAAVEWLSHHFPTTVNSGRPYTDDLLDDYDVLIIKTPSKSIAQTELDAIARFVERGGGLFLVGDHTNLLGMSNRLNQLARLAEIRFEFDAVQDGFTGGFTTTWRDLWPHPTMARLTRTQFMTSCSLQLGSSARPVIVGYNQARTLGDYAGRSFFGNVRSDPRTDCGPVVLAAEGTYGRGRIAAFSDSTVLSSFALFLWGRERYLLDTVAFLNRSAPNQQVWTLVTTLLCSAAVACGFALLHAAGITAWLLGAIIGGALALLGGLSLAQNFNLASHPAPSEPDDVPRISVWAADCEAQFPPVLGADVQDYADQCYDTWYAAILRSGVFPKMTVVLEDALEERGLFVLQPRLGITPSAQEQVGAWVRNGGRLVVAVREDHFHAEALTTYLGQFGYQLSVDPDGESLEVSGAPQLESPSQALRVYERAVGEGRVLLVLGAEVWSRERLGHAFSVPDQDRRACYETLAWIMEARCDLGPEHRRSYRILE